MSIVVALGSPLVGWSLDKWGSRRLALGGTIALCLVICGLAATGPSEVVFLVLWTVLGVAALGATPPVFLMAVTSRFTERRGLALSLVLCGSNLIGALAPMLAAIVIQQSNWRSAYLVLGAVLLAISLPLSLMFLFDARDLRRQGTVASGPAAAPVEQGLTFKQAMRTRNFWLLTVAFFLAGFGINAFLVHLVPMLTDKGIAPLMAAGAISTLSMAAIGGRLAAGYLLDRTIGSWVAALLLLLPIPACAILLGGSVNYASVLAASVLIGLANGSELNMVAFLTAKYFGTRNYGVIHGVVFGAFIGGCTIGPPGVGVIYGAHGNYHQATIILAITFLLSALAMSLCRYDPKQEHQVAQADACG
jgi:MFS family permease